MDNDISADSDDVACICSLNARYRFHIPIEVLITILSIDSDQQNENAPCFGAFCQRGNCTKSENVCGKMVSLAGIEPATCCLEGSRSIQLSYRLAILTELHNFSKDALFFQGSKFDLALLCNQQRTSVYQHLLTDAVY